MQRPLALIVGGGGVLGAALQAEFAQSGYRVAVLRRQDADLADAQATAAAIDHGLQAQGAVDVLVYNVGHLVMAPFLQTSTSDLLACLHAGPIGAMHCARAVLPSMAARGAGCLIFTGATASLRGSAHFAAMAAGKAGLRALAQALAREFQPQGVHVAHVVLDGLLQGSPSEARFGRPDGPALAAPQVAMAYRMLAQQPRGAWTHELDLRPAGERF